MANFTEWYLEKLGQVQDEGVERHDKISLVQQSYSTHIGQEGLPMLHLKPTPWKSAVKEMLWFISGNDDYATLHNSGCTWWSPWIKALTTQDLAQVRIGPVPVTTQQLPYLKHSAAFDRISKALLSKDFDSTRLYANLWPSEEDLDKAVLPPCALAYQVTVTDGYLNLTVTQRSADLICGVPSNVIQYAFLLCFYADISELKPGRLVMNFGDLHIYKTHIDWSSGSAWTELNGWERSQKALKLSKDVCLFYLQDLGEAKYVKIVGPYEHCGRLNFPVVAVHVPMPTNTSTNQGLIEAPSCIMTDNPF